MEFRSAAAAAGLRPLVERLSYRWPTTRDRLPTRSGRLTFAPADDAEVMEVLRRLVDGTLDADSRRAVENSGVEHARR